MSDKTKYDDVCILLNDAESEHYTRLFYLTGMKYAIDNMTQFYWCIRSEDGVELHMNVGDLKSKYIMLPVNMARYMIDLRRMSLNASYPMPKDAVLN